MSELSVAAAQQCPVAETAVSAIGHLSHLSSTDHFASSTYIDYEPSSAVTQSIREPAATGLNSVTQPICQPAAADVEDEEPEVDIVINNVVCSFNTRCHLNLKRLATDGMNVIYKRDQGVSIRVKKS